MTKKVLCIKFPGLPITHFFFLERADRAKLQSLTKTHSKDEHSRLIFRQRVHISKDKRELEIEQQILFYWTQAEGTH